MDREEYNKVKNGVSSIHLQCCTVRKYSQIESKSRNFKYLYEGGAVLINQLQTMNFCSGYIGDLSLKSS